MFRKTLSLILSALMIMLAVACSPPGSSEVEPDVPGNDGNLPEKREVRISISVKRNDTAKTRAVEEKSVIDPTFIRDDIKGKTPSEVLTPKYFIMNIPELTVYQAKEGADASKGSKEDLNVMKRATGDTMNMVNFLTDRGVPGLEITDANSDFFNRTWNGIYMHCSGFPGGFNPEEGYDHYYGGSFIGVKLPDGISISDVVNARDASSFEEGNFFLDDTVAWFSWNDLNPIKSDNVDSICFQYGLENVRVINPYGLEKPENGDYWIAGPRGWTGGVSCLTIPIAQELDFRGRGIPEIEIEYDTENLITLYEIGEGQYRATFNLEDPYPFSIDVDEWDPDERIVLSAEQKEEDIKNAELMGALYARRPDGMGLTYIKPNYEDIDHIEIWHSTEDDISKAELIYSGLDNSYLHKVENVFDPHHYWGYTVNDDGEKSNAVKFLRSIIGDEYVPQEPDGPDDTDTSKKPSPAPGVPNDKSDAGTVFRDNLNENLFMIQGEPAMKLTPAHFLATISNPTFYNAADPADPTKGTSLMMGSDMVPVADSLGTDLLSDKPNIHLKTYGGPDEDIMKAWNGVALDIDYGYRLRNGNADGTVIGISLPEGLAASDFDNSISTDADGKIGSNEVLPQDQDKYVWFSLQELIPVPGFSMQILLFQNGPAKGTYYNPEGIEMQGYYGPLEAKDMSSVLTSLDGDLDLSEKGYGTQLRFSVDPNELIWVYEYVSNGRKRYHAVLNLDDPFPWTMTVKSSVK